MPPSQQHAQNPSSGLQGFPFPRHAAQSSVKVMLSIASGNLAGELQSQAGATSSSSVQEDAQLLQSNSQLGLNTTRVRTLVILGWGDHHPKAKRHVRAASGFSAGCSSLGWAKDKQDLCHALHMSPGLQPPEEEPPAKELRHSEQCFLNLVDVAKPLPERAVCQGKNN